MVVLSPLFCLFRLFRFGLVSPRVNWGFSSCLFVEFLIYYVLLPARQLHQGTIIQQNVLAQLEEITERVDIFLNIFICTFILIISFFRSGSLHRHVQQTDSFCHARR